MILERVSSPGGSRGYRKEDGRRMGVVSSHVRIELQRPPLSEMLCGHPSSSQGGGHCSPFGDFRCEEAMVLLMVEEDAVLGLLGDVLEPLMAAALTAIMRGCKACCDGEVH